MSIRVHVSTSGDDTVVTLAGPGTAALLVHLADGVGAIAHATDGRVFVDVGRVHLLGVEPEAAGFGAFVDRLLAVADGRTALVASRAAQHESLMRAGVTERVPVYRSVPQRGASRLKARLANQGWAR